MTRTCACITGGWSTHQTVGNLLWTTTTQCSISTTTVSQHILPASSRACSCGDAKCGYHGTSHVMDVVSWRVASCRVISSRDVMCCVLPCRACCVCMLHVQSICTVRCDPMCCVVFDADVYRIHLMYAQYICTLPLETYPTRDAQEIEGVARNMEGT